MSRTERIAVIGILALLAVPTAYSFQQQPVVAGHTTYADMDGLDPCIAGIVGIVRLRVMWFNDQVLFERAAGEGNFVYALQSGAPDPRERPLAPTGNVYPMADPNGMDWEVHEYSFNLGPAGVVDGGNYSVDPSSGQPVKVNETPSYNADGASRNWYVWVVETGPAVEDFAATGRPYNFVNLVDTCKFTTTGTGTQHSRDAGGNWTSDWSQDTTEAAHDAADGTHGHDRFDVDLYVGKAPRAHFANEQNPEYLGVPQ